MGEGVYGKLESITPPITIPAWACMMTGFLPGRLGFYGFRNRRDYSYDKLSYVSSMSLKEKTVWDVLGENGFKSVVVGFPPSYPPKTINGCSISCFLTPNTDVNYTYPPELKGELEDRFGPFIFDVRNFRTEDKDWLKEQIYNLTEQRFEVAKYLINEKEWDFFFFVEMGLDRLHHGFWRFFDKEHRLYEPGNPYEDVVREYYKYLDGLLGDFLELVDDETTLLIVSDHGAKRMEGGICINEWFIKEGYLVLKSDPKNPTPLTPDMVDWNKTKAWGEGGYYGRIFLNVKYREPEGTVPQKDYEKFRQEIIEKLEALGDENGNPIGTRIYRPEELYPEIRGIPPDLVAIFGNLYWRSAGTVGLKRIWIHENDTGPDDANHAMHGIFITKGPGTDRLGTGMIEGVRIIDLAPTILELFGLSFEEERNGRSVFK
jgi:predicted AlkP superfamily phosphohydrolase/phosphomutase